MGIGAFHAIRIDGRAAARGSSPLPEGERGLRGGVENQQELAAELSLAEGSSHRFQVLPGRPVVAGDQLVILMQLKIGELQSESVGAAKLGGGTMGLVAMNHLGADKIRQAFG